MIYQITALLSLFIFYSVYIGKMLLQKRKGIQTDQIAKGEKNGRLYLVEITMKFATYGTVVAEIISILLNTGKMPSIIRTAGVIFAFSGVAIFAISVWTMRDSWRAGIPTKDKK